MAGLVRSVFAWVDWANGESSREVDDYIDSTYFYLFRLSGLYPYMSRRSLPLTVLQMVTYVTVLVYHCHYLLVNALYFLQVDLVLVCQAVHFALICIISLLLILNNASSRRDLARIHRHMLINYFDYEEDWDAEEQERYRKEARWEMFRLSTIPLAASLNGVSCMFFSRLLDKTFGSFDETKYNINFQVPFPGLVSEDGPDTREGLAYYLTLAGQLCCLTICLPLAVTSAGFLLLVVLLDFARQLRILLLKIETCEDRAAEVYRRTTGHEPPGKDGQLYDNTRYMSVYKDCLAKCFQHHAVLLSVFANIQELMGFNFIQCYIVGSVIIAISANIVTVGSELPGTTFAAVSLCVNEIAFMYLLSEVGQRITDLCEEVREKLYGVKWYHCDQGLRRSLTVALEATIRPMTIMGGKIIPVNLNTFSNVMNSAYTYFNLLTAFSSGEP